MLDNEGDGLQELGELPTPIGVRWEFPLKNPPKYIFERKRSSRTLSLENAPPLFVPQSSRSSSTMLPPPPALSLPVAFIYVDY